MANRTVAFSIRGSFNDGASFDDLFVPIVPENCQNATEYCTSILCISCGGLCFKSFASPVRVASDEEQIPSSWLLDGVLVGKALGLPGIRALEIDMEEN